MADIRVDNNKNKNDGGRNIWPWIIGALILIGLIWGVAALTSDDDRDIEANRIETTTTDDNELRPIEEERVRNERIEDDRTLENDRMRDDRMMEDEQMRNDRMMEDDQMRDDRVRDDAIIE